MTAIGALGNGEGGSDTDDAEGRESPHGHGRLSRADLRFQIVATVLLAVAALGTAWSGYQASLWDGIQSSDYSKASALRTEAAQQATAANQYRLADLGIVENYLDAAAAGDVELAEFYRSRMREEAQPAFEDWIALDPLNNPRAPASPFASPDYQLEADKNSAELTARAEATFAAGEDANTYSDILTLATLILASVLFFSAIAERFTYGPARWSLLGVAGVGLVVGLVVAFTQPLTSG